MEPNATTPSSSGWSARFAGDAAPPALPVRTTSSRVLSLRRLSDSGYELTFERQGLEFMAGMNITIHGDQATEDREYTLCSGTEDEHLQVLFRTIPAGTLTGKLAALQPGDSLRWTGPFGAFTVRDPQAPIFFIGTGTGIAPCRAYIRSHPLPRLTVVQGARTEADLYYRDEFAHHGYHPCVSREPDGDRPAYVTDALAREGVDLQAHYYLCGAFEMIHATSEQLIEAGVPRSAIFTEAYYYKSVS